jgi:cytochrome P450
MSDGRPPAPPVDDLLRETRAAREAVHELIARMRRDRRDWERDMATLLRHARLTSSQRQRLGARFHAARRGGGSTAR